jgi:hypothetical protein
MVVRINTGKSITGVLRYNELKREEYKAELISSNGFLPGVENLNSFQLGKRFRELTALNTRTKTNALHISLNFAPGESIDTEMMKEIAHSYLDKIGFGNQPCLIYQHKDAGHPHLHIVTVSIDATGKRIETHNLGKNQSEKARKELETEYKLVPAEKQNYIGPDLKTLGEINYGETPSKSGLNAVLNHVWNNYQFSSFGEYNAVLKAFKVEAYRGESESQRYLKGGLVYHFLDKSGKRLGVPLKASSFYSKPTLKNLERRYPKGKAAKESLLPQIRARLELIHSKISFRSMEEFESGLKKQGITLSLNYGKDGRLFGVTYVDHTLRIGVKGSDLGKDFGAAGLADRFNLGTAVAERTAPELPEKDIKMGKVSNDQISPEMGDPSSLISLIALDLEFSDSPFQGPVPKPRKKKKKKGPNSTDS